MLLFAQSQSMAALLTLTISGSGTVIPNLSGSDLVVGKTYTISAIPGPGYLFSNWSGNINNLSRTLKFVMQEGLTLQANFVPNPFLSKKGTYTAISPFHRSDSVFMHLTLAASGAYSCKLLVNGKSHSCSGRFDVDRTMSAGIDLGPNGTAALSLALTDNPDGIGGYLSTFQLNTFYAEVAGYRAVFNAHTNPATSFQGKYTVRIAGPEPYGMASGYGYASLSIDLNGRAKASGKLPDGVAFANSSDLGGNGTWLLFAPAYGGKGYIRGAVYLDYNGYDAVGTLRWIKPPGSPSRPYLQGIEMESDIVGARYSPPLTGTNRILASTNWIVRCEGTNLVAPFEVLVELGNDNKIFNESTNHLLMKLNTKTGIFTGTIDLPDAEQAVSFGGVVFQNPETGYGQYIAGQTSGRTTLAPTNAP